MNKEETCVRNDLSSNKSLVEEIKDDKIINEQKEIKDKIRDRINKYMMI
jgi:predicted Rdx family selenoprotein